MTEIGWWLAKMSRTSARTIMPRISAATPRLFSKASSRTPKALMIVDPSMAMIGEERPGVQERNGAGRRQVDAEQRRQDQRHGGRDRGDGEDACQK